jgi:hypothetical protein
MLGGLGALPHMQSIPGRPSHTTASQATRARRSQCSDQRTLESRVVNSRGDVLTRHVTRPLHGGTVKGTAQALGRRGKDMSASVLSL